MKRDWIKILFAVILLGFVLSSNFVSGQETREDLCAYSKNIYPVLNKCCTENLDNFEQCIDKFIPPANERSFTYPASEETYTSILLCLQSSYLPSNRNVDCYERADEIELEIKNANQACHNNCEQMDVSCKNACDGKYLPQFSEVLEANNAALDDWKRGELLDIKKKLGGATGEAEEDIEEAQETSGDEITPVPQNPKLFSAEEVTNAEKSNDPLYSAIEGLKSKGSLTAEEVSEAVKAYRSYQYKINANKGEPVKVELPLKDLLPIDNAVALPAKNLVGATTTITFVAPILGRGAFGNPDYPLPNVPLGPPPEDKYTVREYFKVSTTAAADTQPSTPFYSKAWFGFSTAGILDSPASTKLLRYDETAKQWDPLPTQYSLGESGLYKFTAESPGTSWFAIVAVKEAVGEKTPLQDPLFLSLILIGWPAIVFLYLKYGKDKIYNKLKSSKGRRIEVLHQIPFKTLVFKLGMQFFAIILLVTVAISLWSTDDFTRIRLFGAYISGLIFGFIIGLITWLIFWGLFKLSSRK